MPPAGDDAGLTLARLLETLGRPALSQVATLPPDGPAVTGPHIYDPADPGTIRPGDLVLAVNIDPASPAAAVLVAEAAGAGAVGVAFKQSKDAGLEPLLPLAESRGLALVRVDPQIGWDQLHALIGHATASAPAAAEQEATPLGDLFALANALAATIGGAVSIEDPAGSLLAYSTLDQPIDAARRDTILGRRTPGPWLERLREEDVLRRLSAAPMEPVHVQDPRSEAAERLVVSVTAGAEVLGVIWVLRGARPLDDEASRLLGQVAPLAALHLLRHRAASDLARTERGRLLEALLDRTRPAHDVGPSLGIDPTTRCAVVCFHLAGDDELDLAVNSSRATDLIVLACEAFRRRVACTGIGRDVYALFSGLSASGGAQLVAFARDIAERAGRTLGIRVVAGVGSVLPGLAAAPASRVEADRVVRVLLRHAPGATAGDAAGIEEVRLPSILVELGDVLASRPDLRLPALEVIARHDAEHDKSYLATLRALAEAFWDIPLAARSLTLHPNSLRYRIRRIEQISGLQLADPQHRLLVSLQLVVGPELGPSPPEPVG